MNRYLSNKKIIALFILPTLILFSAMLFYPLTKAAYTSFFEWNGFAKYEFIGFDNYLRLFKDRLFYKSIQNQLIFALVLILFQIPLATLLAYSVSTFKIKGVRILRIAYFLPVVLSVTVVCQLWLSILNAEFGLINTFFDTIGVDYKQSWLTNNRITSIVVISLSNGWHFLGMHFAIILAGIKGIPEQYYEAAKVDGASSFQVLRKITIPLLRETYKLSFIMAITGGLNAFVQMYIMTGGGPGTNTYTMTYMMYQSAFGLNQFGYSNSISIILVVFSLAATFIINKSFSEKELTY